MDVKYELIGGEVLVEDEGIGLYDGTRGLVTIGVEVIVEIEKEVLGPGYRHT